MYFIDDKTQIIEKYIWKFVGIVSNIRFAIPN